VLKEGIAKFLKLDSLMENLTGYVETRIEIMKYDLKEDLSKVLSQVSIMIGLVLIGMFALLFISLAIAVEVGQRLGYLTGFGLVASFYIILGIILFVNRDFLGSKMELKIKEVIKQKKR
jgi:hypothetical protein